MPAHGRKRSEEVAPVVEGEIVPASVEELDAPSDADVDGDAVEMAEDEDDEDEDEDEDADDEDEDGACRWRDGVPARRNVRGKPGRAQRLQSTRRSP
jgi:hypothetical protein